MHLTVFDRVSKRLREDFVVVPRFVRAHTVPATDLAGSEKKVDRGERRPLAALVARLDARAGAVDFAVMAAFGVGLQVQRRHQLLGACVHGDLNFT